MQTQRTEAHPPEAAHTVLPHPDHMAGLKSPSVGDKVAESVALILRLVAGFGSSVPVERVVRSIDSLGRSDAYLVLQEISESKIGDELRILHPHIHSALREKVS